jgi:hypothetical protein
MQDSALAKQTFQEKISERRKKMLKFHFRGISATEWVSLVAQEYGITEIAIWQDWRRRKSWLSKVFNLNDVVDEINMNMVELMNVKEEAWRTYHKAENAQSKAAALKIVARAIVDKIEILQSLGEVHREPQKIEIEGRVAIVELLKVYAPIAERIGAGSVQKNNSGK